MTNKTLKIFQENAQELDNRQKIKGKRENGNKTLQLSGIGKGSNQSYQKQQGPHKMKWRDTVIRNYYNSTK